MIQPPDAPRVQRDREVLAYANSFAEVFDDEVRFQPGDEPGRHLRIRQGGGDPGVVVLPVRGDTLGLVLTYRYPVSAWQWGLPRGFAHGADPLASARAELGEELGAEARTLRLLGHLTPDSGLLESRVAVVLAEIRDAPGPVRDTREVARTHWPRLPELRAWIAEGRLEDGMTLAALALAGAQGELPAP